MAPGLVGPEKAARGKRPSDCWWHTIVPTNSREKTGYPTQKPEGIVRRMVAASSRPGGWCLDPFAGSGTLGAVCGRARTAFRAARRNPEAIAVRATRSPSSACRRDAERVARVTRHVSARPSRGSRGDMENLSQTPTEPHDYAAVNVVWATLLTALLRATARDGRDGPAPSELPVYGLATFALTKALHEGEGRRVGARAARRGPAPTATAGPRGRGLRYVLGERATCPRCLGTWSSLGLVGLRVARPREGRIVAALLATAG